MVNNEPLVNSNSTQPLASTLPKQTNNVAPSIDRGGINLATYQSSLSTPTTSVYSNMSAPTYSFNWNNTSDQSTSMYHLALQQQQHYSHMLNLYHRNLFERLVLPTAAAAASATAVAFQSTGISSNARKLSSSYNTTKRQKQQHQFTAKIAKGGTFQTADVGATSSLVIGECKLNSNDQVGGKKRRRKRPRRRRHRKKRSEKLIVGSSLDGIQSQATSFSNVDSCLATK